MSPTDEEGAPLGENSGAYSAAQEGESGDVDPDGRGGAVIVSMGLGGISGLIVGLLCRGELLLSGVVCSVAVFCGLAGWWARGLR
ncbi:hypothetical protein [Ochrobactrum sp. Marseille-Q0166]|uniref:hypothetical protein n=1 Tax=Ochrobactrum sp. Marseille-Q0166 TaxID=2761105 RepID=UPI001655B6E6|nr:hypothetical protein [Ochrobactrum sp. Marseille-Q0166]MBC8716387.1 hypothetical protein [Ochrobactrum sp. Marseille-Q0166]